MNSATWTEEQKIAAGKRFVERLEKARQDPDFQEKLRQDEAEIQDRIKKLIEGEKA